MITLTNKQSEAIKIMATNYTKKEPITVISGFAGTGKAQPNTTLIPTPEGIKQLGEISVGDFVYDRKGNPTKVLGVYPQGELDSYTVTLSDGRKTKCNNEHLWTYYTSRENFKTITLQEMIDSGLRNAGGFKYKIPVHQKIAYEEKVYRIDPYLIGVFLGDGCCLQEQLTLSSMDEEIVNEVARLSDTIPRKNHEKNYNWVFMLKEPYFNKRTGRYNNFAQTKTFFESVKEVIGSSHTKRIPEEYKKGSSEQRLTLLQGIMDTDGGISYAEGRYNIRYTSVNKELMYDVSEVLWSLGYANRIGTDNRSKKYKSSCAYNMNINIPNDEKHKLFRVSRKKDLALKATGVSKRRFYDRVGIIKIERNDYKERMTCIKVDNSESLYLTNDYIVTHNTSIINYFIENNGLMDKTRFVTFTGKASLVLQNKGLPATTIHKLIYDAFKNRTTGKFIFRKKEFLPFNIKLIVVDEVSMVPANLLKDLMSYRIPIISLGDPGQLEPIGEDNGLLKKPDFFLDEIHRQAADNSIIKLSMMARENKPLPLIYDDPFVKVIKKTEVSMAMLQWADQILCGRNITRRGINQDMRNTLGHSGTLPNEGEKVICLRNYWDSLNESGDPLINGTLGYVTVSRKPKLDDPESLIVSDCRLDVRADYALTPWENVPIDTNIFKGFASFSQQNPRSRIMYHEFDFGYAITTHKAQGSEFEKVLVFEERLGGGNHARWLYTAITRASEQIVIVKA